MRSRGCCDGVDKNLSIFVHRLENGPSLKFQFSYNRSPLIGCVQDREGDDHALQVAFIEHSIQPQAARKSDTTSYVDILNAPRITRITMILRSQ